MSTARLGEIMGLSERTVRKVRGQLVAARVVAYDPGSGSRAAGYRLNPALDKWRGVPWAVPAELVEFRARQRGWIVEAPTPEFVRAPRGAGEGFFVRASRGAEEDFLSAPLGAREPDLFVRASGGADKSAPSLVVALPNSELRASDSLSRAERERGWATVEASELAAAITARGNGSPDPRSSLGPRVEALARAMSIEEARRRLATAPATHKPPWLVDWLEGPPGFVRPAAPVEPLWVLPADEPDEGAALDHDEILARLGGLKAGLARRRGVVGDTMKGDNREGVNI